MGLKPHCHMNKTFQTNDFIKLPQNVHTHAIIDHVLIIDSIAPNWLVLTKEEYEFYKELEQRSLINALKNYKEKSGLSEENTINIAKEILKKISDASFFNDTDIYNEEAIENITKNIQINVTSNCNIRCKHCYLSAGKKNNQDINYEQLSKKIFELTSTIGPTDIVISGGEPLTYPKIFELLKLIHDLKHKCTLFTNATLINTKNITQIASYVDEVQISMEGISKEKFEEIRGKNTYNKLIAAINLLKKHNIHIILAITSIDSIIDDIEANLLPFLNRLNYENLTIRITDKLEKKGNALLFPDEFFKNNLIRKVRLKRIVNNLSEMGFYIDSEQPRNVKFLNCGIGASIVINSNGKIYPCNNFDIDYFDLADSSDAIINKFNILNDNTAVNHMSKCQECELKLICCGGCKIANRTTTGNYLTPTCNKKEKYLDLILNSYF